ncbi:MAG: FAD-binding oxidoreductase [Cyanothece sp. SIO1E1]|nr:FAD-binding oxidoreductase [Cyanothece sp. SIO1E1]
MTLTEQLLSGLPGDVLEGLRRADQLWTAYRTHQVPTADVVQTSADPLDQVDWDVVICGGTLGILIGAALVQKGWRVALLERGILRGRDQEWNISRRELSVFLEMDLLDEAELEAAIATEYNPARISFLEGTELWVNDVLNIGVDPVYLLATLKAKFLAAGGQLFEETAFSGAVVHPNGIDIKAGTGFKTRLLLDVMGHFSPIARQARQGQSPDAVCLVVGTCAQGFAQNDTGDLFASFTPLKNQCQYFWEAFPAHDGRTTYMFTYLDPHPDRPSLEDFFEDYLHLLPQYQGVPLAQLQFQRALFGFFPCYRQSPLRSPWDRILQVGDSSGNQSPLSFGGFGAMIRHLERLTQGISDALEADLLHRQALALLQPYQPSLSVTWLFQRSMSAGVNQKIAPNQINALLSDVFQSMDQLGTEVLQPFLQDVVQFPALCRTLAKTSISHPDMITRVMPQVGLPTLITWAVHYFNLGVYAGLSPIAQRLKPWLQTLSPTQQYYLQRWIEALQYGSGGDY